MSLIKEAAPNVENIGIVYNPEPDRLIRSLKNQPNALVEPCKLPAIYPLRSVCEAGGQKTARRLGLQLPPTLLARADEVNR